MTFRTFLIVAATFFLYIGTPPPVDGAKPEQGFGIRNIYSKLCLRGRNANSKVTMENCDNKDKHQTWFFNERSTIKNAATELCLELSESSATTKVNPCTGVKNQDWILLGQGHFAIKNVKSNTCLQDTYHYDIKAIDCSKVESMSLWTYNF